MGLSEDEIQRREAILKESQEIVKADFDLMGSLIKNREIPKNVFLKIYWHEVLKCWQALEKDIKKIQNDLNDEKYMENFKYLNNIATKYAKREKKIKDITKLVHKDIRVYPFLKINEYDPYTGEVLIESDEDLDSETVNHNEKPNEKKCYVYLTTNIKDHYGISLNKPIKSNFTF